MAIDQSEGTFEPNKKIPLSVIERCQGSLVGNEGDGAASTGNEAVLGNIGVHNAMEDHTGFSVALVAGNPTLIIILFALIS